MTLFAVLVTSTESNVLRWIERGQFEGGIRFVRYFKASDGMELRVLEQPRVARDHGERGGAT